MDRVVAFWAIGPVELILFTSWEGVQQDVGDLEAQQPLGVCRPIGLDSTHMARPSTGGIPGIFESQ